MKVSVVIILAVLMLSAVIGQSEAYIITLIGLIYYVFVVQSHTTAETVTRYAGKEAANFHGAESKLADEKLVITCYFVFEAQYFVLS